MVTRIRMLDSTNHLWECNAWLLVMTSHPSLCNCQPMQFPRHPADKSPQNPPGSLSPSSLSSSLSSLLSSSSTVFFVFPFSFLPFVDFFSFARLLPTFRPPDLVTRCSITQPSSHPALPSPVAALHLGQVLP